MKLSGVLQYELKGTYKLSDICKQIILHSIAASGTQEALDITYKFRSKWKLVINTKIAVSPQRNDQKDHTTNTIPMQIRYLNNWIYQN